MKKNSDEKKKFVTSEISNEIQKEIKSLHYGISFASSVFV